ncbi:TetR/AcrR family transcriptional regulator C-terminal domain-containing protein [Tardiphaga sp.]|uniref:TetR/AcrR family transcriptional regulator C-terminal domain-containing protein n=1 Tax=Tardiphaga sp. TaxID=1926292 RepID=UPI00352B7456
MTLDEDPRRKALLDAAAELFFKQGYADTSVDDIIARAGGSKRAIYAFFGNKQGLFEALLRENAQSMFDGLEPGTTETSNLSSSLISFAERLLTLLSQPRAIAAFRVAVGELPRIPVLAAIFNEMGPERGLTWLTDVLEKAHDRGEIDIDDPREAAGQFLGLVRGNDYFEIILGLRSPPSAERVAQQARAACGLFLKAVRA